MIARASANVGRVPRRRPGADLIGRPALEVLAGDAIHALRNRLALLRGPDAVERSFGCRSTTSGKPFDVAIHIVGPSVILEAEPSTEHDYGDATGTVRGMICRLDQRLDHVRLLQRGRAPGPRADRLRPGDGLSLRRRRLGRGRRGERASRHRQLPRPALSGHRHPGAGARALPAQPPPRHHRHRGRAGADRARASTSTASRSTCRCRCCARSRRSTSNICATWACAPRCRSRSSSRANCGACSPATIIRPRCPSFERRSVAELFAQMFSMRLESRERQEIVEYERRARDISDQLLGAVAIGRDPAQGSRTGCREILTQAIPADGVGVWINGSYAFSGPTPDDRRVRAHRPRAQRAPPPARSSPPTRSPTSSTDADALRGRTPRACSRSRSRASPARLCRAVPLRDRALGALGAATRTSRSSTARTARASRRARASRNGRRRWSGRSQPFTSSELRVAETLRATLIEVVLRLADEATRRAPARRTSRQELLIAELNHRVRNILGADPRPDPPVAGRPTGRRSRNSWRLVDGRIHALARAHNQITDDHWGPAPLKALIEAEAAAFLGRQSRAAPQGGGPRSCSIRRPIRRWRW